VALASGGGVMGLFGGKKEQPVAGQVASASDAVKLMPSGVPNIEVAGESYHRNAVAAMFTGWGLQDGGVKMCHAVLQPEPTNKHDRNAVKVLINNNHIGYVPADYAPSFAAALKKLKRGQYAYCDARAWGTRDDGTWRARVTLVFDGTSEPEHDYAAERAESEAAEAEREQRRAEKEAAKAKQDTARAAATVDGSYWRNFRDAIAELKRQGRLDEARVLLEKCVDAAEIEGRILHAVPDPWATEQLSVVLGKLGDPAADLAVLERYERACRAEPVADKVAARLIKARLAG